MSDRLDIDDVERFWNGQLAQTKAHPEREYLVMLIRPDEARDVLRLLARIRELEAQAEVVAAEKRHRRAASQMGIFESTDGGLTWHHVGDREEYDASYKALVIARAAAEKGER